MALRSHLLSTTGRPTVSFDALTMLVLVTLMAVVYISIGIAIGVLVW